MAAKFPSDIVRHMMNMSFRYACGAALTISATACGRANQTAQDRQAAPVLITLDGSSKVFPIAEAVAEEFGVAYPGTRNPTVGISGTGGGFQKFCRGETDISNASRPIRATEIEACAEAEAGVEYVELPVAYNGIAIVVNPENTWAKSITVEELGAFWSPEAQGTVTRWNQIRAS